MPNSNWANLPPSIFSTMSALAAKYDAVNLAQGFPDFDGPAIIKDAACAAIAAGKNQYAPASGLPELRSAFCELFATNYGHRYDPQSQCVVFSGATEALFATTLALLAPGDELVTFEPFYEPYRTYGYPMGATVRAISLRAPDWSFSEAELAAAVGPNTKALLLNSPHNPTGKVFSRKELECIAGLAKQHDFWLITDEVYDQIIFADHRHIPMATLADMAERTITIQATSKTFSFTGWKVGYAFGPAKAMAAIANVHASLVFCSATPLQHGLVKIKDVPARYYKQLSEDYQKRRDRLSHGLKSVGFRVSEPAGSYFMLAGYEDIPALASLDDIAASRKLVTDYGVAAIPTSVFYSDTAQAARSTRHLRFGFCKHDATLDAAISRLDALRPIRR